MPHDADLIDAADLLLSLSLPETTDSRVYERFVSGASEMMDKECGAGRLRQRSFTDYLPRPPYGRELRLRNLPVVSITSITDPAGNTVLAANYVLRKRDGVLTHSGAWPTPVNSLGLVDEWAVVYVAGHFAALDDVPEDLKVACLRLATHLHSSRVPGVASKSAGDRSISYRAPAQGENGAIPDEIKGLLAPYIKRGV